MATAVIPKQGDVLRLRLPISDRRTLKYSQHYQSGRIFYHDRCGWRVIGARKIADHVEFTLRVAEPPRAYIYS